MKYDANGALLQTEMPELNLLNRGKVRDLYDLGDSLLFVATDRISAFDCVMPNGIPDKGRVLTQLSNFWFDVIKSIPNHVKLTDVNDFPPELAPYADDLKGRSIIVKKAKPLPVECIARGYITGTGWKDYQKTGEVCGIKLREHYQQAEKLDKPLFTPSTKAEEGLHDENISFSQAIELLGEELANKISDYTLEIYSTAEKFAKERGVILADTKFEFGLIDGEVILIDEVLTPDSSRYWPMELYKVGGSPPSLDKQFVRDYLETLDWGKVEPAPELPQEIVEKTREKYIECYEQITGQKFPF
jgi:phosphoribosylaminoimidazole-succinocarboxamide synthase